MKRILWFSIVLAAGLYIVGPIVDPDLWWHITAGKWMLAHASVPRVDYWNLYAVGTPWRAYSWSNELLFALVDKHLGIHGLLSLKVLFAVLLSFSLFYCFGKIANDWFFGALLGGFATAACYNHFTLRPQTLVWTYYVWLLYLLISIEAGGLNKRNGLLLFGLFSVWANTHVTTILGITAVILWLADSKNPASS